MGRGSATEDDIAAGIRAVGVLSAVAGEGTRRDNPFAAPPKRLAPSEHVARAPQPVEKAPVAPASRTIPPIEPPAAPGRPVDAETIPKSGPAPKGAPKALSVRTKADVAGDFDNVTFPMRAAARSRVTLLAAELQRHRTDKTHRFTTNSVLRVAVEAFLERFELAPDDHVNSEEELLSLVSRRLGPSKRAKGPGESA